MNIIVGIFFQVISRYVMRNSKDGKRKINFLIKNIVETDSDIHKAKMLPKPVFNYYMQWIWIFDMQDLSSYSIGFKNQNAKMHENIAGPFFEGHPFSQWVLTTKRRAEMVSHYIVVSEETVVVK